MTLTRATTAPIFAARTPLWARMLITAVCMEYKVPLPHRTVWRVVPRESSSGKHSYTIDARSPDAELWLGLSISAGTDERDARHVVLHELAHFLDDDLAAKRTGLLAKTRPTATGRRRPPTDPHNQAFFRRALPLFEEYGQFSLAEAVVREVRTYPSHRHDLATAAVMAGHAELVGVITRTHNAQQRARRLPPVVLVPIHDIVVGRRGKTNFCKTCGYRLDKAAMADIGLARRMSLGPMRHQVMRRQSA